MLELVLDDEELDDVDEVDDEFMTLLELVIDSLTRLLEWIEPPNAWLSEPSTTLLDELELEELDEL